MTNLTNDSTRFARAARALLILGFSGAVAWGVKAFLGHHNDGNLLASALGFVAWAGTLALCVLLVMLISRMGELLKTIGAAWRPLAIVALAAYFLIRNDQGQELGVSLMIDRPGWLQFVILFLALVYWALNGWHAAKLGINAAIGNKVLGMPMTSNPSRYVADPDDPYIFWTPRVIGVCAHVFAALNLALAAQRQPEIQPWLAWIPPIAVIVVAALVRAYDYYALSERTPDKPLPAYAAACAAIVLLVVVAVAPGGAHPIPSGFRWSTFAISLSAFLYLFLVSWLGRKSPLGPMASSDARNDDDAREAWSAKAWTFSLFALAVLIAILVLINPIAVGLTFGSMAIACFALGALLAAINALAFAIDLVHDRKWLGETTKTAFVAYALVALILLGLVNARLHPFHQVRLCEGGDCKAPDVTSFVASPDARPSVEDAAKTWYAQAKAAYQLHGGKNDDAVPMVVVATAGGGIRAAYWTAAVLEKLESDLGPTGVRPYLFAISGVSGGSVGATAFEAALAARDENKPCKAGDEKCPFATSFLTEDFLAPVLASWVFKDMPSAFLPDLGQDDRGAALEKAFEHASHGLLARPFLSLFPYGENAGWRPILLLNATHEETGKRIIAGHVLIERNVFIDSLDALHILNNDVRASTAAHNSARFTYVSPAGELGPGKGSVIDGGYYENYGALTALELARTAETSLKNEGNHVKLVILLISSDPDLDKVHSLVRIDAAKDNGPCLVSTTEKNPDQDANYLPLDPETNENAWLNELFAPFQGITKVREAHGNRAAAELAVTVCAGYHPPQKAASERASRSLAPLDAMSQAQVAVIIERGKTASQNNHPAYAQPGEPYFAHVAMCESDEVRPPLGWMLSVATRDGLDKLLSRCGNDFQLQQIEAAVGPTSNHAAAD